MVEQPIRNYFAILSFKFGFLLYQSNVFLYLIQTNNICIPSSAISQKTNMGSFAANSGSSATTSAEGSDDECIETKGKHFDAGVFRSFSVPLEL